MIDLDQLDRDINPSLDRGAVVEKKLTLSDSYFKVAVKMYKKQTVSVFTLQQYFDLSPQMLRMILEFLYHNDYVRKSKDNRISKYMIKDPEEFELLLRFVQEKRDMLKRKELIKYEKKANRTNKSKEKTTQR